MALLILLLVFTLIRPFCQESRCQCHRFCSVSFLIVFSCCHLVPVADEYYSVPKRHSKLQSLGGLFLFTDKANYSSLIKPLKFEHRLVYALCSGCYFFSWFGHVERCIKISIHLWTGNFCHNVIFLHHRSQYKVRLLISKAFTDPYAYCLEHAENLFPFNWYSVPRQN